MSFLDHFTFVNDLIVKIWKNNSHLNQINKKTIIIILTIVVFILSTSFNRTVEKPTGFELLKSMIAKTNQIESLKYHMKKTERINGVLLIQESYIKFNRSPFNVYIKQLSPKKGLELVYIENFNKNKVLIKPNDFPWINFNLHPKSNQMRKNQHHTILETGFDYLISILNHFSNKYGNKMNDMIMNKGTVHWRNKLCWSLEITNPNFKFITYIVKEKEETILTIADKFMISSYMILENNHHIKNYADIYKSQKILIPTDYSSKINLLIDFETLIPYVITIEDNKGVFEKYEITQLEINPQFEINDFSLK